MFLKSFQLHLEKKLPVMSFETLLAQIKYTLYLSKKEITGNYFKKKLYVL